MVWSQPDEPEPQPKYQNPSSHTSSRRRTRRSSTSTIFTTTTGYAEDDDNDTTTYSQRPQPTIPLAYAPSEATSANRTYTQISQSHISPTPHPSQDYQSQGLLIPSAQPITPILPLPSGPAFSTTDEPSPLPSPPGSLPSAPSSPAQSRRTSSYGSFKAEPPPQTQPQSQPDQPPRKHTPSQGRNGDRGRERSRGRARGNNRGHPVRPSIPHQSSQSTDEDTMGMSTLLEGIGRMHIAMNQDPAGRWRIKRNEQEGFD